MFTGIIETTGIIQSIKEEGANRVFYIHSPISNELKIDQSLSHNGVCLTVEVISDEVYRVTAIAETLIKSNLGKLKTGDKVNLERCLRFGERIDGHIVQGHVDTTAVCIAKKDLNGSVEMRFKLGEIKTPYIVEKGSIAINGVSLTVYNVSENEFSVSIIPYTLEHSNFKSLEVDGVVNIEYDIIGKYILRSLALKDQN